MLLLLLFFGLSGFGWGDGGCDAVAWFAVFVASAAGDVDDDGVVFVDGFLVDGL